MAGLAVADVTKLLIQGTCTFTDHGIVSMSNGNNYRLLSITKSGTLTFSDEVNCEVCIVGGGSDGDDYNGGAGAYMLNRVIEKISGANVIIGAAKGASSFNTISVAAVNGKSGGTGGGAGMGFPFRSDTYNSPGTGDGLSKYPFGDTGFNLWSGKPHCAGGGAGGNHEYVYDDDDEKIKVVYDGGNGGTNGSNGGRGTKTKNVTGPGGSCGSGGVYGGGQGGQDGDAGGPGSGLAATYYGSGGGGKGGGNSLLGTASVGAGYQGIIYVRIPVDQSTLEAA